MAEFEFETHVFTNIQENLSKIVLDNITSVTLNTDILKINFEAIVTILKGLAKKVNQGHEDSDKTSKDVKELQDRLEKLEHKQNSDKNELNDKISSNQQQIEDVHKDNIQNAKEIFHLKDSVKGLEIKHDDLRKICKNNILKLFTKLSR